MKFQIGAMSVGDILDRGLKLLLGRLPAFYLVNLIVLAPLIAFQMVAPEVQAQLETGNAPTAMLAPFLSGVVIVLLLTLILQPFGTAATLYIIAQDFVDQPVRLGSAFRFAFRRLLPLLGTSIIVGIVLMVGFMLCLAPGFIFLVWYVFYAQVVVMENTSGGAALNRSKALTEGYRWRVFGLISLLYIAVPLLMQVVIGALGQVYPPYDQIPVAKQGPFDLGFKLVPRYPNFYVVTLVGQLFGILVQTYQAVCMTLLYFDLRIRKEGFDLEVAARQQLPAGVLPGELAQ